MRHLMMLSLLLVSLAFTPIIMAQQGAIASPNGNNVPATLAATAALNSQVVLYVDGSTKKVCQLTGEIDREFNTPTVNQTETRWGLSSVDGGHSFDHDGKVFFLFGNGNPTPMFNGKPNGYLSPPRRPDQTDGPVAFTTDTNIENCLKLDVITNAIGAYNNDMVLNAQGQPAITLRVDEGSGAGFSQGGRMYALFATDNLVYQSGGPTADNLGCSTRSVLAVSDDDGRTFQYLYDFSSGPDAKFVGNEVAQGADGYLYFWGVQSGTHCRQSAPYFARKKAQTIDQPGGMEYFAGFDANGQPTFSASESDAVPLFHDTVPTAAGGSRVDDCMGEHGIEWNRFVSRWVMLYNCFNSKPNANDWIYMRYAEQPWGPYSAPQVIFNPVRDKGFCYFIHRAVTPTQPQCDNLGDPAHPEQSGSGYGPFIVSHYTVGDPANHTSTFYWTMSTWRPYQKVLMQTTIQVQPS